MTAAGLWRVVSPRQTLFWNTLTFMEHDCKQWTHTAKTVGVLCEQPWMFAVLSTSVLTASAVLLSMDDGKRPRFFTHLVVVGRMRVPQLWSCLVLGRLRLDAFKSDLVPIPMPLAATDVTAPWDLDVSRFLLKQTS